MKLIHKIATSLLMMALPVMANAQVTVSADNFDITAGGEATFAVNMANEGQLISDIQFDMTMPDGITFKSAIVASERSNGHKLTASKSNGKDRITIMGPMTGDPSFKGNKGPVAYVTVQASSSFITGKLAFSFVRPGTPEGASIKCNDFDIIVNPAMTETIEGVKFFVEAQTLDLDEENKGVLPIMLDNPKYFATSAQFDLTLPDGLKVVDVQGTDRSALLTTGYTLRNNGTVRVVIADLSAQFLTIAGNDGAICNVFFEATDKDFKSGDVKISGIKLVNANNLKYTGDDITITVSSTAGIENVTASQLNQGTIYNLQGVKVAAESLNKGVYIQNGKKFVIK